MITITLAKFRRKPTAEELQRPRKVIESAGGKIISAYWTLGRFDAVFTTEWPDEKAAMKASTQLTDIASSETMVAIPREEALKLAGY
ncbi:MAG: GYD domain-containing protein [Ignavibacteriae bacterium]|nr:GYD domain-containing protein [Ignavibacteria bacterium]MBI3363780.1 GYD domain-containing protein [Ignavibacteriota bacterium]